MAKAKIKYEKNRPLYCDGPWISNGAWLVRRDLLQLAGAPKIAALIKSGDKFAASRGNIYLGDEAKIPDFNTVMPKRKGKAIEPTPFAYKGFDIWKRPIDGELSYIDSQYGALLELGDVYQIPDASDAITPGRLALAVYQKNEKGISGLMAIVMPAEYSDAEGAAVWVFGSIVRQADKEEAEIKARKAKS